MLDYLSLMTTIKRSRREDRAMLRSNPSGRPGTKHFRESLVNRGSHQLLATTPCFGPNAINLNPFHTQIIPFYWVSVGHISRSPGLTV